MKPCIICAERKPLDEFYTHPQMADGHLNKCKVCCRIYTIKRELKLKSTDLSWYEGELSRHRAKQAKWRILNRPDPDAVKRGQHRWSCVNKNKRNAELRVARAVRAGVIIKSPCEKCGYQPAQAHHDDYSQPLNVRWLCVKHHNEHHVEQRRIARAEAFQALTRLPP